MEGNSSSGLEEDLDSHLDQSSRARFQNFGKGTRLRNHSSRFVEEEIDLETLVEKILETGQETNLGAQQKIGMERSVETSLEDGEETNLGSEQETHMERSLETNMETGQETNLGA